MVQVYKQGRVYGSKTQHTQKSLEKGLLHATVALPKEVVSEKIFFAKVKELPQMAKTKVPVVVFMHGSRGINPELGYDKWQRWLAKQGIASIIFDSMRLKERLRYHSPVKKDVYERVHKLRASEIEPVLAFLKTTPWADTQKLFLAGSSEGAVSVARYDGEDFLGKIIYSWTCEDNYYVSKHKTDHSLPVLNIMSTHDGFFTHQNNYLDNAKATGCCALSYNYARHCTVVKLFNAPHTLFNLKESRRATKGWIEELLG